MQGDSAQINAATIIPIIATIVSLLLPPSPAQTVNRPSLHQTLSIYVADSLSFVGGLPLGRRHKSSLSRSRARTCRHGCILMFCTMMAQRTLQF